MSADFPRHESSGLCTRIKRLERWKVMKTLFWVCLLLTFYAYAGYPAWLFVEKTFRPRPIRRASLQPSVSIVMAVFNGGAYLAGKLKNLRDLHYPSELLQVILVSDGSTDETAELLQQNVPFVEPIILPRSRGKAAALNVAVKQAKGDILFFMDVRQRIERNALVELVSCFADEDVGAVSGELIIEQGTNTETGGVGLYWQIEKMTRKLESDSGSVIGVTGAIYAIRRQLYQNLPEGTILDDVLVPMSVARAGRRVVFLPTAVAYDQIFQEKGREFSRKVRTLTGNYQLVQENAWLLSLENPLLFRLVSHKLLRLPVPGLLILMLIASGISPGEFYHVCFGLQVGFYALALMGALFPVANKAKPIGAANAFVMLNAAAALAFYNFVRGRRVGWTS